jgi:putative membrane protein
MNFILDILRGVVIGVANIIPGVSGGTMMVSMGIYDKIIGCINNLFKSFKNSIMTLLPYGIGMALGILGLAKVITYCLDKFPLPTSFLFIGLILGSLPIILKWIHGSNDGKVCIPAVICGFVLVVGLQILGKGNGTDAAMNMNAGLVIILFLMGVIASATMVIPCVSGSMMLMLLGYYNPIVGTISTLVDALVARNMGAIMSCVGILLPFGLGVIFGIFAIAKLIEVLLEKFPSQTFSVILGLVLASPVAILMATGFAGVTVLVVVASVLTFAVGFVAAMKLGE